MRRRSPVTRERRGGYTLVELIVVISVNSALMAVAVGLLGTLLRTEHQGQQHFERTSALVRLADQFRGDVAASRDAIVAGGDANHGNESQVPPRSQVLRLPIADDRTIEYLRDGERLRRVEYLGPTVVRREAYTLIEFSDVRFLVSDAHIVSLHLKFGADANVSHGDWQIDARLARDRRFAEEDKR
jgi:Tfp pilus assembly protein FimT